MPVDKNRETLPCPPAALLQIKPRPIVPETFCDPSRKMDNPTPLVRCAMLVPLQMALWESPASSYRKKNDRLALVWLFQITEFALVLRILSLVNVIAISYSSPSAVTDSSESTWDGGASSIVNATAAVFSSSPEAL